MELNIFNTYVPMENQAMCDRIEKACLDNNLPYWKEGFSFLSDTYIWFSCIFDEFWVGNSLSIIDKTQVTEQQWLELLKNYKL